METFEEDPNEILKLVGMKYEDKRSNAQPLRLSTEELTRKYFKKLPQNIIDNLVEIYKYDFELFDYDPYEYIQ